MKKVKRKLIEGYNKIIIKTSANDIVSQVDNYTDTEITFNSAKKVQLVFILRPVCILLILLFVSILGINIMTSPTSTTKNIEELPENEQNYIIKISSLASLALKYQNLDDEQVENPELTNEEIATEIDTYISAIGQIMNFESCEVKVDEKVNDYEKTYRILKTSDYFESDIVFSYNTILTKDGKVEIKGIIKYHDHSFEVVGRGENLEKVEFELFFDDEKYIKVEDKDSQASNALRYSYFEDKGAQPSRDFSIELYEHAEEKEIKLLIDENRCYEFGNKKDGITCKFDNKKEEKEFNINVKPGSYEYEFGEDEKIIKKKSFFTNKNGF